MTGQVFLAVAGSIGSGKTTLTRTLSERLGYTALYEETTENPYLEDFYGDMRRHALPLQLRFLVGRVAKTREVLEQGISLIQDRTCYEDAEIFAANLHLRGEMDDRDWETYGLLAEQLLVDLPPPDLLVYLCRSAGSCREQIHERGRSYEAEIPMDYLSDLSQLYDNWFESYNRGPKLFVQAERYDFRKAGSDVDELVARISESLPQRTLPLIR